MIAGEPVNAATLGLVLGHFQGSVFQACELKACCRGPDRGCLICRPVCRPISRHKLVKAKAGDVTVQSLVAERSRLTKIKADNAELEARKLAGELVPAADIEAAWLGVAGTVRTRLLLIPAKTAPRIVALKTAAEAQALLRKEINAALSAIATTPAI